MDVDIFSVESEIKVEGGKLVKFRADKEEGKFKNVKIRGDFFLEPPEALEELEKNIEGAEIDRGSFKDLFENVGAELIGFSAANLEEAVLKAVNDE